MILSKVYKMKYRNDLTAEYVRECLDYDPETGLFKWKTRPLEHFKDKRSWAAWNTKYANKKTGMTCSTGYLDIRVNNRLYRAHRLAWLIVYGKWPDNQIDHNDGKRDNNKIDNLSDVPHHVNGKNQKLRITNTSGHQGVSLRKNNTWIARITVNNKDLYLGSFKNIEEAIKVRKSAEIEHGFHANHGDKRKKYVQ
jgi:hypothetical protein